MVANYSKGDWIVHAEYGLGQIKKVVEKEISGEPKRYFRIAAANSVFWVPVEQMDGEMIRPLSTQGEIAAALALFEKSAKEMSSNYKIRQERIRAARRKNTPRAIARLLRDLREHWRNKRATNVSERRVYQVLKARLAREWAVVDGGRAEAMEARIDRMLNPLVAAGGARGLDLPLKEPKHQSTGGSRWRVWSRGQSQKLNR
jgi:RNA polymerase-interacting CarD/CdnL/TRCF family regulator